LKHRRRRISTAILGAVIAVGTLPLCLAAPQTKPAPPKPAAQVHPEDAAIIGHLDAAITWYKQLATINESAGQPSDAIYLSGARAMAKQVVVLAFQSAEAEAAVLRAEKESTTPGEDDAPSPQSAEDRQRVAASAANIEGRINQYQSQIDQLNGEIAKTAGKKRQDLVSKRDTLQQQVEFEKVLQEGLEKLPGFMNESGAPTAGLQRQIDELKKSVPEVFAKVPAKATPEAPASATPSSSAASGLLSQAGLLLLKLGDVRDINQLIRRGEVVSAAARQVRLPLRTRLRATIQQGRSLAGQTSPNATSEEENRARMAAITAQYKQLFGATLPLAQELALIEDCQASLREWEASVHSEYVRVLGSFLVHLAFLLAGIAVVWGLAEVWRRATFRYIREARRRHHALLLRRIVTVILMTCVLLLAFVSEFGSLATFAGFLTAGVAVALQTLILSVAAYFFLIGRHGIRVGDRISVSGVTGDVIEVGMVRIYMMELSGAGAELHTTGRVVTVSNSVLFQGTPFYKQIPGTAYAWHEVAVKLDRDADFSRVESKLLEAVNSVYALYRESLEQQHQTLEGLGSVPVSVPSPQVHVHLVDNGLELAVRYPVVLHREAEIKSQMARVVMQVIDGDPKLKTAVGSPVIRAADKK
jgi:small-conductance mechanosensitive channel